MLIAYYFPWNAGAAPADQCEGCSFYTSQVRELSFVHSRDVTYATFCQRSYAESIKYRDFMGWDMPWYSEERSLDTLLVGRRIGMMHLARSPGVSRVKPHVARPHVADRRDPDDCYGCNRR